MSDPSPSLPALTVQGGAEDGARLGLDDPAGEWLLGSDSGCHLAVSGTSVSPIHARIVLDEQGFVLTDAKSAASTFVNGLRVDETCLLRDGDHISLGPPDTAGSAELVVSIPGSGGAPQPESEPEAAPEPAHDAPAAPEAPAPSPQPRPVQPDYMTEPPSMVPEGYRSEEAQPRLPPPTPAAALPKPLPPRKVPQAALLGLGAAVVALGAWWLYASLQQPAPVVTSLTPSAQAGQDVAIQGTGFEPTAAGNAVRFEDILAPVRTASATNLITAVPNGLVDKGAVNVRVSVEARGVRSNALFLRVFVAPRVKALVPPVAMPGEEVVAWGTHLEGQDVMVTVGGLSAEVIDAAPDAVRFRLPDVVARPGEPVSVRLKVGQDWSDPQPLMVGRLPIVLGVFPAQGTVGEYVSLRGFGFDASPEGNAVTIGGRPALVVSAQPSALTVVVPVVELVDSRSELDVRVVSTGYESSAEARFTAVRLSATRYIPRFFPAPVPGASPRDHVFVSTELGPVLLLSGKAEASSTAERARLVAERLTALVTTASSRPVQLELKDSPALSVAAAGNTIVAVTEADAAGYEKSWDPALRGGSASSRRVAAYWTALLQDYLLLFVQRDRPYHVLELSPRGEVLTQLYQEAVQRAGVGGGVPLRLVSPLDPPIAEALRRLAIALPGERPASGAAAIVGRWDGSITEPGGGRRAVEVRFTQGRSGPGGTLITRAGGITGELPLRSIRYEGGTLRFVLDWGGLPRHFRGTFEGARIEGTLHASASSRDELGRLELRYSR